jgi:hypothetical protein
MTEQEPQAAPSSVPEVTAPPAAPPPPRSFWLRELPFTIVLILTIAGVAYTTFSKQTIAGYWEILAPIIGLVCIGAGWQEADDKTGRLRLIVTQALHWGVLIPRSSVQERHPRHFFLRWSPFQEPQIPPGSARQ